MRVAVVDIGSNSTRLLVADVQDGTLTELERRSIVTRLGQGVDTTGMLADEAQGRVFAALDEFAGIIDARHCDAREAVMTSAVRDAANGAEFAAAVRERYGLNGQTIAGDEEARLSFLGATATRPREDPTSLLVIDIGGGSTELVVGAAGRVAFHVSTQNGVVRHTERHLHGDPPASDELAALSAQVRESIDAQVPQDVRAGVREGIAVAGTATSCAGIDRELVDFEHTSVEGHVLSREALERMRDRLAAMPVRDRRGVTGLHPDRAPTIVAGVLILLEAMDAFGLDRVTVSERDILWGVALDAASLSSNGH